MIECAINQQILPDGNFVFLDCETANKYNEICQIAAIIVQDGKIIKIINEYVKPKNKFSYKYHTEKHGITASVVKNANSFNVVWEDFFAQYLENFIFISHGFKSAEHNFIKCSLEVYNQELPEIKYICTKKLAEKFIPNLKSYRREFLVEYFNFKSQKNHDALSDTIDCLNIFLKLRDAYNFDYRKIFFNNTDTYYKEQDKPTVIHSKNRLTKEEKDKIEKNIIPDEDFNGKRVVLTGEFERYPGKKRKELELIIGQRGGRTPSSVSSVTDMLVIGKDYGPDKYDKAITLGIRIIDEETFYKMLDNGNEALTD